MDIFEQHKEDIRTWVAALRSEKYKQTRGALQDINGYCCLGVACNIFINDSLQKMKKGEEGYLYGSLPSEQPLKVVDTDFASKHETSLSGLNDEENKTFMEIADLIEKTYLADSSDVES